MVKKTSSNHKISLFTLAMISCALVVSVRNLPTEAETGMHMIFFALVAAIGFFIPVALVSAELATGWPKLGGLYSWIKHAFGDRWGFVGVWLQWCYMMIGSIAMLYFVAGALAYVFMPNLADNKLFIFIILLITIWGATLFSFRGLKASGKVSTIGFVSGVLIPGCLIIALGAIYIINGNPLNLDMSFSFSNMIPDLGKLTSLVLLLGFMRTFTGIEVSASHANEVKNPKVNYPKAIFIVIVIGLLINILGSLSVASVVPQQQLSLVSGLMEAFKVFFSQMNLAWLVPIIGVLVTIGAIGGISAWTLGPVKGVLASANNGELPKFFRKVNHMGIPINLLIIQAIAISAIGGFLLLMPQLNTAFWISNCVACCIYFFMYGLMLLAALKLRYKEPNVKRAYKVPFGNAGMWIICLLGLFTLTFGFIIAFLPPAQLSIIDPITYMIVTSTSILALIALPFIIYALKKPSWAKN